MEFVNLEPTFGFPENFPGKTTNDPKNKQAIEEIRDLITLEIVKTIISGHDDLFQYIKTNKKIERKIAIYAVNPTAVRVNPLIERTFGLFEPDNISVEIEKVKEEVESPFANDKAYNKAFFVREILKLSKEQIQEMLKINELIIDISSIILYEAIQQNAGTTEYKFPTEQQDVVRYIKNNFHIHNLNYDKINWTQCHLINAFVTGSLEGVYTKKIYTPQSLKSLITGSEITTKTKIKIPSHSTSGSSNKTEKKKDCVIF